MSILRSVTAAKGLHKANNLAPLFETPFHHWKVNEVGKQRIGRNKHMSAGDEDAEDSLCELHKEAAEITEFPL